ncbi:MAG: amidohydrolase [Chloroflexota bacterium]|nr:amidohydrolase [Chloroflexota bacterium]
MFRISAPVTLRGARIWHPDGTTPTDVLHVAGGRVVAQTTRGATTIDLDGYHILPGLINTHDHLELNHYPRTRPREHYDNAHNWGEDVSARLGDEPFRSLRAYPLADRCFMGGLKNLLSGALTVAHHNPPHRPLFRRDFPVRVLPRYGWAHSLHFASDAEIVRSYRTTPHHIPWFIHLAEGTDARAAGEYMRLRALGCVGANTVLVHGVGMTAENVADAVTRVRGLVRCPTTNDYLLGTMGDWSAWAAAGKLALGSDSRLTAAGDLLDELALTGSLAAVTTDAARLLGMNDVGHLAPGAHADWIVVRDKADLRTRATLALIVRGGVPQIGDPDLIARFPQVQTVPALLDGVPKRIERRLAARIKACGLRAAGLEI